MFMTPRKKNVRKAYDRKDRKEKRFHKGTVCKMSPLGVSRLQSIQFCFLSFFRTWKLKSETLIR